MMREAIHGAAISLCLMVAGVSPAFGATKLVPAGATTAEINTLLGSAAEGDTILFAPGATYDLTGELVVKTNVRLRSSPLSPARLRGPANQTCFRFTPPAAEALEIDAQWLRFEGFAIAMAATPTAGVDRVRVRFNEFESCLIGLRITNTISTAVRDVDISLNAFNACRKPIWVTGSFDGVSVKYNVFVDCWQAMTIHGLVSSYSTNLDIERNYLFLSDCAPPYVDPGFAATATTASQGIWLMNIQGLRICTNVIEGYDKRRRVSGFVPGFGIQVVWGAPATGGVPDVVADAKICHNLVRGCMIGIQTIGARVISDAVVEHNRLESCTIGFGAAFGSNHVTVRSNAYCGNRALDVMLEDNDQVNGQPSTGLDPDDHDGPDADGAPNLGDVDGCGDLYMPPIGAPSAVNNTIHERVGTTYNCDGAAANTFTFFDDGCDPCLGYPGGGDACPAPQGNVCAGDN